MDLPSFSTGYRLNTYPLVHAGLLHAVLNVLALTPLLARFETDSGSLLAAAFLAGRECPCLSPVLADSPSLVLALLGLPHSVEAVTNLEVFPRVE